MENSREKILQTALKLFLKKPYKEVSLRDIVNKIGLTKGAFYHYYTSKEQLFEKVVKSFYNSTIIADYRKFPKTSLKEFYIYYLDTLREPDDFDESDGDMNLFTFISEASKRVPDFLEMHLAQCKKELWAWTEIIGTAKSSKEIKVNIPNEELANIFLKISDGIAMDRAITGKSGLKSFKEIRLDWDNLYNLLKTGKK